MFHSILIYVFVVIIVKHLVCKIMDQNKKFVMNKYDRVMPRVYNRSRSSLKSNSFVTRHQTQSSTILGGNPSVSNVSSVVFSDLPIVLNDYKLDSFPEKPPKRPFVVKPRRTLKSLDPALSPPRSVRRSQEFRPRPHGVRSRGSAPSVLAHGDDKWPESHIRQCLSSSSHSKLKELKVSGFFY